MLTPDCWPDKGPVQTPDDAKFWTLCVPAGNVNLKAEFPVYVLPETSISVHSSLLFIFCILWTYIGRSTATQASDSIDKVLFHLCTETYAGHQLLQ